MQISTDDTEGQLPAGLTSRPITVDDVAAMVDVLEAVERAEPTDEHWGVDEVREEMDEPGLDLQRGSYGVFDGDRLVGFGVVMSSVPEEVFRATVFGAVHPEYGHRRVGTAVVRALAASAAVRRDRHDPALPGELKMWIQHGRVGTAALAAALGFENWRWFFRMRRDLAQPVASPAPAPGFEVRPYRAEDEEAVRVARNLSFADHWGSSSTERERWHAAFEGSSTFRPRHSRLAIAPDGSVAAFVMVQEFAADTRARGYATGYVSLVGAVREARGRGLASGLLGLALDSMAADGYRFAELEVDADSPTGAGRIYERVGFVTVERSTVAGRRF